MNTKKLTRQGLILLVLLGLQPHAAAQALPASDIWIISIDGDSTGEPRRLVHTGRYNNQPAFSNTGDSLYFTMEQPDGQTDIAEVDVKTGSISVVHHSDESEYSPTLVPGKESISVVRVESPDQRQRLWELDLESGKAETVFKSIEPVGYHAWIRSDAVAMFLLGETFDLHVAKPGSEQSDLLVKNIGRTLLRHPKTGELLFVDKNQQPWQIAAINIENGLKTFVMPLFPNVEDFSVDKKGRFWMGSGSKLYRSLPNFSKWELIRDYSEFGINGISRLTSDSDFSNMSVVFVSTNLNF